MNDKSNDKRLTETTKQLFDESVDSLNAATLSRLNKGRHEALAELQNATSSRQWVRWAPATGIAAAALVAVMVMRGPAEVTLPEVPVTASDIEILLDDQALEMLEDLEFYSWIDASDLAGSGDVG
jgi:hypothetical protein